MVCLYNCKKLVTRTLFVLLVSTFIFLQANVTLAVDESLDSSEVESEKQLVLPAAPVIESEQFPLPSIWYSSAVGTFSWSVPSDVIAVAVDISKTPEVEAKTIFTESVSKVDVSFNNLSEGRQYLVVQFKNNDGWGSTTSHMIQVDTLPPELLSIGVSSENIANVFPDINFYAKDKGSGIDYYLLYIGDKEPVKLTSNESIFGYTVSNLEDGTYSLKVVAVDMAGNSTQRTLPVIVTAGWTKPATEVSDGSETTVIPIQFLLVVLLVLIILFSVYLRYEGQVRKMQDSDLKRETQDIKNQMVKIFSALRDEIYDQINSINKRPRLSKTEKKAVEGLNKALEVSETLIEKEIDDVKKMLK